MKDTPEELKEAAQKVVDSFFTEPPEKKPKKPKKPKELPIKCSRCDNYTFVSFGACHVCENPVDEKGKFKYKKQTKGF